MNILIGVIASLVLVYFEPMFFAPFSFSLYLVMGLIIYNSGFTKSNLLFLFVSSIFLDITMKYLLGSHSMSLILSVLFIYLVSKIFPNRSGIIVLIASFMGYVIALLVLGLLFGLQITTSFLLSLILPSVIASIIISIFTYVISQFKSGSSLGGLKLK